MRIKQLWCFLRGHYWVGVYCPVEDDLHPYCTRCKRHWTKHKEQK